ncbi:hypothetical protein FJZ36_10740 [Candidatus Poribacteria bacterium]|nr:hypothetical protein [Candidatus Poribacteria bacterium]
MRVHGARQRLPRDAGLSLVATLWIAAVLAVLATEYIYIVQLERRSSQNLVERTQLEYIARSGIAAFIRNLTEDDTSYDAEDDTWAEQLDGEIEDPMRANDPLAYQVVVTDENTRIDINKADEAMLQRVLALTSADTETQQSLPAAIIEARNEAAFRSVGDLARVEGMTSDILYGSTQLGVNDPDAQETTPLIDLVTVYSTDKNVSAGGQNRTNITSADANALRQGLRGQNNSELLSQAEADAIVAYRQGSQFQSVANLLDVPAVTQSVLDGARDQLSTQDEENRTNINSADANQLAQVNGFDQGTAEDVVRHRQSNGNYSNVDAIRDARVFTRDELKQAIDSATIVDGQTLTGVVNVNTASQTVLALLPGMDENRAQAIIDRRGTSSDKTTGATTSSTQQTQPFTTIGDLLDVPGIDENVFKQIANFVTYRTQVFRLQASGIARDGKALARIMTVLDRSGEQVRVRYWANQ